MVEMERQQQNLFERPIFKKLNNEKVSLKEKKQARKVLISLFGFVLLATLLSISYREIPRLKKNFFEPAEVVSRKYPAKQPTATPTPKLQEEKKAVEQILEPLRGEYGVFYQNLISGDHFSINGKKKFQAASLNKLPAILTLYREAEAGKINLDTIYKLKKSDQRNGAGNLQYKPEGYEVTFRKMVELMCEQSDNTAFNIVSLTLGVDKIQSTINQLGMMDSSFSDWKTTPEDIGLFFRKLYKEKVVNEKDREEILSYLTGTIYEDRIPAGLPKNIKVAHKIGTEIGVISDAGIVFAQEPFILVIMSQDANEIEAQKALPEITRKIYEFHQKISL